MLSHLKSRSDVRLYGLRPPTAWANPDRSPVAHLATLTRSNIVADSSKTGPTRNSISQVTAVRVGRVGCAFADNTFAVSSGNEVSEVDAVMPRTDPGPTSDSLNHPVVDCFQRVMVIVALMTLIGWFAGETLAYGQIDIDAQPVSSKIVEPVDAQTASEGFHTVFQFRLRDVDPRQNDKDNPGIECIRVQNLGSATNRDIKSVRIVNDGFKEAKSTHAPGQLSVNKHCPSSASANGPVAFEAFFPRDGVGNVQSAAQDIPAAYQIPNVQPGSQYGPPEVFDVQVKTRDKSVLRDNVHNHTLQLQVTVQYGEPIDDDSDGSLDEGDAEDDPINRATVAVTDPQIDRIQNRGVNGIFHLDLPLSRSLPISQQSQTGENEVAKFAVCDGEHSEPNNLKTPDSNAGLNTSKEELIISKVFIRQGPSGTATVEDIKKLKLKVDGSPAAGFQTSSLQQESLQSGNGVPLSGPGIDIGDDKCSNFTLIAEASSFATRGRTLQPIIKVVGEESGLVFKNQLAPSIEAQQTSIIGSGIIRIENKQIAGSEVSIEAVRVPNSGLQKLQTVSVEFDPDVVRIDGVPPVEPYQTESVKIDNRSGKVQFDLTTSKPENPANEPVFPLANLQITPQGDPGDRSTLLLQVGRITNGNDDPITRQTVLTSGSVTLLAPGDVNMDGKITVNDVLRLAQHLVNDCDDLRDFDEGDKEVRIVADVTGTVGTKDDPGDKAPEGKTPTCTDDEPSEVDGDNVQAVDFVDDGVADLTSADMRYIAESAIRQEANVVSSQQPNRRAVEAASGWWAWFMQSLGLRQPNEATLEWSQNPQLSTAWDLSVSSPDTSIGGFQGRIRYDPDQLSVQSIQGINGYDVLASQVDAERGEVRFLALAPEDNLAGGHRMLRLETRNGASRAGPQLQVGRFIDPEGQPIAFKLRQDQPVQALRVSALELQHPSADRWTLNVHGQGVENVEVQGYDLGGQPRFQERTQGSRLQWRALDEATGRPLANGVYLYRVTVEGVNGDTWRSDVRKLIVLR